MSEAKKFGLSAGAVAVGFIVALAAISALKDYPVFEQANDVF